ncbi:unnamed protein product [Rotaria sp. Silwood2]|nr:unnamed protein product [Rotaria sp. Silwood2]
MEPKLTWAKNTRKMYNRAVFIAEETPEHDCFAHGIPKYAAHSESMDRFEVIEIVTNNEEFFYEIETFSKRRLVPQSDLIHVLHMYGNKHSEMRLTKTVTRTLSVSYMDKGFNHPNAYVVMKLTCKVITK